MPHILMFGSEVDIFIFHFHSVWFMIRIKSFGLSLDLQFMLPPMFLNFVAAADC
jgi:hypothetical protein